MKINIFWERQSAFKIVYLLNNYLKLLVRSNASAVNSNDNAYSFEGNSGELYSR